MSKFEILTGIGVLLICMTWCGVKVSDQYLKTVQSEQRIEQTKVVETVEITEKLKSIDGVVPWVSDLVSLSITNPEKFRITTIGSLWAYKDTGIWVSNGVMFVQIWGRGDIQLTELEKTTLYNAFTNWNKKYAEEAKLNYKID